MSEWVKVRADFRPMPQGFALLDKANLVSAASGGDALWSYPTLASGLIANANNPVRYRKDDYGLVIVQGAFAKNTSGAFTGTAFTLPAGYRPLGSASGAGTAANRPQFWVYMSSSGFNLCRVSVSGDGQVYVNDAMFNGDSLEFGCVSFLAEN